MMPILKTLNRNERIALTIYTSSGLYAWVINMKGINLSIAVAIM